MNDLVVYAWQKSSREEVRALLREFNGHRLADLRVFVPDGQGGAKPTPKGLAIRVEDLAHLRDAVDALLSSSSAFTFESSAEAVRA